MRGTGDRDTAAHVRETGFTQCGSRRARPQAQAWQNHATHNAEHYKDIKSVEFRGWGQPNQQAMMQHVAQHEQFEQQQQQAAQDAMLKQESSMRNARAVADSATATRSAAWCSTC